MILFDDIEKVSKKKPASLMPFEQELLRKRAAIEMAKRSVTGAMIVPLCFALALVPSGFIAEHPELTLIFTAAMLCGVFVRLYAIGKIVRFDTGHIQAWLNLFYCGCVTMSLVWGALCSIYLRIYGTEFPVLMIFILSAGIGAGSLANFCVWRKLAFTFLFCTFFPSIVSGALLFDPTLFPLLAAIVLFVIFIMNQINYWNHHFWDSLLTAFFFEKQAELVSETNTRLEETITREQRARSEVEEGRAKMRQLFDRGHDGIVICEFYGKILEINETMLALVGLGSFEGVHKGLSELLSANSDEKARIDTYLVRGYRGENVNFECLLQRENDHSLIQVLVNIRRIIWQDTSVLFVTVRDITIPKKTEQELDLTRQSLAKSEGYLQAILRNIEMPIYCKDLKGRYLIVNSPFEQLSGFDLIHLQGRNDLEVFGPGVGRFFSYRDAEIVESGESVELEGTFFLGGKERNLLVHKFVLKESDGFVYGTAGICTDVTTMKKTLRAAQLANEAKSEFLANMSHELRTPMHSILCFARLGQKRAVEATREKLSSYFEMIVASGDQLLELLSDLLDLSTLESSKITYQFRKGDLVEDITSIISEYKVLMQEQQIRLRWESDVTEAETYYDKTKIIQVLRNLLSNAMKFTPSGKEVLIRLEKGELDSHENINDGWKISVIDQGIGIPANEEKLVFEKFTQGTRTKTGAGGVGLGLAICKRIIDDHRGKIWASNNLSDNKGDGATISFILPIKN